jgi:L-rhamnose mutarotase
MPRIAFRLWLKPDRDGIETYVWGHLHPFPDLYERIRAAGIRRYTIWLDDTDLLLTREGDDPRHGESLDPDDPVHQEWIRTMTPLFAARVAEEGAGEPTEVFALDPDAEPGPAQMTYRSGLANGHDATDAVAAAYRAMPGPAVEDMRAAGVRREWSWVEDGSAWTYRECDDLDATEAALAASSAYRSWSATTTSHLDDRTRREGPRRTREVFRCD